MEAHPLTQPKRVVCKVVKPKDLMIRLLWFVSELGILSRHEKRAKIHVFGSNRHSIILDHIRLL